MVTSAVIVVAFGWLFIRLVTDRLVSAGQESLEAVTADVEGLSLLDLGEDDAQFRFDGEEYLMVLEIDDDGDVFVNLQPFDDPEGDSVGGFTIDSGTGELRGVEVESDELDEEELQEVAESGTRQILELVAGPDGERIGLIQAADDAISDISDAAGAARSAALIVGPLLVLTSGITTWILVGRALAPTRRIATEAGAIDTSNLDRRMTRSRTDDEVDTIARVINDMLERIEAGVKREQQFVADASHELKTPLTTARMAAELAGRDAPGSSYPPQVIEELDRMQGLVDNLLQLARAPEGQAREPVALDALVANVIARHPDRARIELVAPGAASVAGRSAELRSIVTNLLDNAARYGTAAIGVQLTRTGSSVVLTVDDDGPGIDPAQRERVFERFVRLDEGRARDDGGSGLGLAIVRGIARRHGGDAEIHDSPLGGTRVVVRLPVLGSEGQGAAEGSGVPGKH
ncbi:MAG: HAMP domain-containing sensor histidine kinase [Actinomycetota bacterium]